MLKAVFQACCQPAKQVFDVTPSSIEAISLFLFPPSLRFVSSMQFREFAEKVHFSRLRKCEMRMHARAAAPPGITGNVVKSSLFLIVDSFKSEWTDGTDCHAMMLHASKWLRSLTRLTFRRNVAGEKEAQRIGKISVALCEEENIRSSAFNALSWFKFTLTLKRDGTVSRAYVFFCIGACLRLRKQREGFPCLTMI